MTCTIRVVGIPAPKGSMRGFVRGRRAILVADNKPRLEEWVQRVDTAAHVAVGNGPYPLFKDVALVVGMIFVMPRPKSSKRVHPSVKPDVDKLVRSTFDALTGPIWCDDARVVSVHATKVYALPGEEPGATITVRVA